MKSNSTRAFAQSDVSTVAACRPVAVVLDGAGLGAGALLDRHGRAHVERDESVEVWP